MIAHTHSEVVEGCHRCELGQDEELSMMAEDFWDFEIEPSMLKIGTPHDALTSMKVRYVSDVRRNPEAVKQVREWWTKNFAESS